MLGEGFDMAVILRGVELQGCAAELAGLPILVERMFQEIFLGDRGIQPREKFGVGHGYLQPRSQPGHSRAADCSRFGPNLLAQLASASRRAGKMSALRKCCFSANRTRNWARGCG